MRNNWITHTGQAKSELMQLSLGEDSSEAAQNATAKQPSLVPAESQLCAWRPWWECTKMRDFGHEITAASLNSPSRAEHLCNASRAIAHAVGKPSSDLSIEI